MDSIERGPLKVNNLPLTAFGDLRIANLSPIFQYSYEYTVDNTRLNTNTVVNGGTVTQATGMAVITSSTTTASTALMISSRAAKYKAGFGSLLRFTALFTTGVAGTVQYIGLADEIGSSEAFKNGYIIGFDGATFGFHRFQNDAKTSVNLSAWDDPLDGTGKSGMTVDLTKLNVWAINFQYLGAGKILIYIEDASTGDYVLAHTLLYANLYTVPSVYMPNFHAMAFVNNKATTSDVVLKTSSIAYFVEGVSYPILTNQIANNSGLKTKTTVTTEVAVFTIRNRSTYASKTNFIEILLGNYVGSIEASSANNLGSMRLVRNATLGGTPNYANINTNNSVVEIDTDGTTVTGGEELTTVALAGKNDKFDLQLWENKFLISPGETVTFAALSDNSATMKASILWRELF